MTAALEGGEWSAARPGHTLPPGKTRYPFYRRLGRPQGRSGRAENLVPTGIRSQTVQPVAQSLYRLSYPAHDKYQVPTKNYVSCVSLYTAVIIIMFILTHFSIEYYETTTKHRAFVSKKESYFECIALLKHRVFACVRHWVVVDQLMSFFGLIIKLVLALSCCKKKQNKK